MNDYVKEAADAESHDERERNDRNRRGEDAGHAPDSEAEREAGRARTVPLKRAPDTRLPAVIPAAAFRKIKLPRRA